MTREDIENNVGYWQEKSNLEYISQRQEHGVNDPYMITEIDEAFNAGFDKGYQYAVDKACEWLRNNMEYWLGDYNLAEDELEDNQIHYSAMLEALRKAMEE